MENKTNFMKECQKHHEERMNKIRNLLKPYNGNGKTEKEVDNKTNTESK